MANSGFALHGILSVAWSFGRWMGGPECTKIIGISAVRWQFCLLPESQDLRSLSDRKSLANGDGCCDEMGKMIRVAGIHCNTSSDLQSKFVSEWRAMPDLGALRWAPLLSSPSVP